LTKTRENRTKRGGKKASFHRGVYGVMGFEGTDLEDDEHPQPVRSDGFSIVSQRDQARVNRELSKLASRVSEPTLHEQVEYCLLSQGKSLRPTIVILSAQAVGGSREDAMRLALAIELMHTATLVHDDVLDNDLLRRHAFAVHAKWSVRDAILAGDALLSMALNLVARHDRRILKIMSETGLKLAEGEYMNLNTAAEPVHENEYLTRIKKKSASLFRAAAQCGAIAGHGSASEVACLASFGEHFGMAYQIRDDLSDILSPGKEVPPDLKQQRHTVPLIHLYRSSKPHEKKQLCKNLRLLTEEHFPDEKQVCEEIVKSLKDSGSLDYCRKKVNEYVTLSVADIESLRESPYKLYLVQMTESLRTTATALVAVVPNQPDATVPAINRTSTSSHLCK
jgi:geranylgeranyl pyrophosphate synthase